MELSTEQDGLLAQDEFRSLLVRVAPDTPKHELDKYAKAADMNEEGLIDMDDFVQWAFADSTAEELTSSLKSGVPCVSLAKAAIEANASTADGEETDNQAAGGEGVNPCGFGTLFQMLRTSSERSEHRRQCD